MTHVPPTSDASDRRLRLLYRAALTVCIVGVVGYGGGILWGAATRRPPDWTAWGLLLAGLGFSGLYVHGRWAKRRAAEHVAERDHRYAALAPAAVPSIDLAAPPQAALCDLSAWDALDDDARQQAARWLADELPGGWRFAELHRCELAESRHTIAFFRWQDAEFALLPGGRVTLGYDIARPLVPTAAQLESWRRCDALQDEPEERLRTLLEEYLSAALTSRREVLLQPFLLETEARCYERLEDLEALYAAGLRPPTSDQWEYACSAGARTLFRWGNDCPTDRYPEDPAGADGWNLHTRPNAFGLAIAANPWQLERCAEPGVLRGGDGGAASSGGLGAFHGWLSLATAYVERARPELRWTGQVRLRRAYPLA